jgi:hypothetical protein
VGSGTPLIISHLLWSDASRLVVKVIVDGASSFWQRRAFEQRVTVSAERCTQLLFAQASIIVRAVTGFVLQPTLSVIAEITIHPIIGVGR